MIIYNVTVKVDLSVHEIWLRWMKEDHIPKVMATGCFVNFKILRILEEDQSDGIAYAIQYSAKTLNDYFDYKNNHAVALQKEVNDIFPDKFVAHRTLLREV